MVSTGLHMTELTTKWKELYPEVEISVFTAENSRKTDLENFMPFENFKGISIWRVKNIGKHHGNLWDRILFSTAFIYRAFLFLVKNKTKYDIILITTNPPFLGILILMLKRFIRLPYIIIAYDIYPQILDKLGILKSKSIIYKFWKALNIKVYNNANKIVSIGNDMNKIIVEEMRIKDLSKIQLIHNWSDKQTVFPVREEANLFMYSNNLFGKRVLLYSGTLGTTHNIEEILNAASELKEVKDLLFLFIGDGAKVKVVKEYINNSDKHNVIYLPFQPVEMIAQTLSSATLSFVCLDSDFTGLSVPSKAYGIMAAGVPIIGLMDSNSEISMMIKKNGCGFVWNKDDNRKLSQLILDALEDTNGLWKMKENAYSTFLNYYDIEISVRKYNQLVNDVLN